MTRDMGINVIFSSQHCWQPIGIWGIMLPLIVITWQQITTQTNEELLSSAFILPLPRLLLSSLKASTNIY